MNNTFWEISLAGLLHDIGKFFERSDSRNQSLLSIETKRLKESLRYSHAMYTSQFFEDSTGIIPFDLSQSYSAQPTDNIKGLASYHHNPGTALQKIISIADWCSSGMDREEYDQAEAEWGKKKTKLSPVFEEINLGNSLFEDFRYRYELNKMETVKEILFPKKIINSNSIELLDDYEKLWDKFVEEAKKINCGNKNLYLNRLLSLLEDFTWCIPSTVQSMKIHDISLFAHLKTTAAIATALYGYHLHTDTLDKNSVNKEDVDKFLLVAGDLSGIQSYLFDLSQTSLSGVGKLLRGRSFYISMLTKATIHYILNELDLPLSNCVMDAGGRFILLVPNTHEVTRKLIELESSIADWCLNQFYGRLAMIIDFSVTLSPQDFMKKRFSDKLLRLSDALEIKKQTKFSPILTQDSRWLKDKFTTINYTKYSDEKVCHFDDKSPAKTRDEDGPVSHLNNLQSNLGEWLTKIKRVYWSKDTHTSEKRVEFFDGKITANFIETETTPNDAIYLEENLHEYYPRYDNDNLMTFEDIAKTNVWTYDDGSKRGKDFLAAMKADVDHLGFIFSEGLRSSNETNDLLSISRYSTISSMMNLFFTGYLPNLCKEDFNNMYTVYAGGDDLFMVGPWEETIEFAQRMNTDFKEFTCKNPDIHLSVGIALIKKSYPLRRAADLADELLKDAKSSGRNRINLFNTIVEWDYFEKLTEYKDFLLESVQSKDSKISSSFLNRLLQYHRMFLEANVENDEGKINLMGLRYHSLMAYDIIRNIAKLKGNELINADEIEQLYKLYDLKNADISLMKNLKIPLFWAMYKNRK